MRGNSVDSQGKTQTIFSNRLPLFGKIKAKNEKFPAWREVFDFCFLGNGFSEKTRSALGQDCLHLAKEEDESVGFSH